MYGTGMESPTGVWWKPVHRNEKIWIAIAFGWCMVLFAMMPLWHLFGGQNPSGIRHRVDPADFRERTNEFIEAYRVGEENGIPVVEPPPGSHVYLLGQMWQWRPVLRLQEGAEYTLHLSSVDVNHGFNLYPFNVNFQVVPGYDYGLEIVPTEAGEFGVVCNEFCGVGHHLMVGRIYVLTAEELAADRAAREADGTAAEAGTPPGSGDSIESRAAGPVAASEAEGAAPVRRHSQPVAGRVGGAP